MSCKAVSHLVPARRQEHVLALLVGDDGDGDVLEDGGKNPALAKTAPARHSPELACSELHNLD